MVRCIFAGAGARRRSGKCLRTVYGRAMMEPVDTTQDRFVIVGATSLDDLLELVARAEDRLPQGDPLTLALTGARAQVRLSAIVEPS